MAVSLVERPLFAKEGDSSLLEREGRRDLINDSCIPHEAIVGHDVVAGVVIEKDSLFGS
jgi:hypothetical protein